MRLIAALSWYDEHPQYLTQLAQSLATIPIDTLVAVDGRYALYPGSQPYSSHEEHAALTDACRAHGISLTIHTPIQAWAGNETHKRTTLFALAHAHATPGQDWIIIADGDEVWTDV